MGGDLSSPLHVTIRLSRQQESAFPRATIAITTTEAEETLASESALTS